MALKLSNNATSTLATTITDSATTLSVQGADAAKFPVLAPGDWFPITVVDASNNMEVMKVTARASAVLTVQRAQEGTTALAFAAGARIDLRVTAATLLALAMSGLETAQIFTATQTFRRNAGSGAPANGSAAVVVDSDGVAMINLLSPNTSLGAIYFGDPESSASGRIQYAHSTNELQFYVAGAEAARFFSGGQFAVGRTTVNIGNNDDGIILNPDGTMSSSRNGTSNAAHVTFLNNAAVAVAVVGSITTSGSATSYNTSSDERLKDNLEDFDSGALLDSISVYHFDWKGGGSGYGVKAQECHEVFPDAVSPGQGEPGSDEFFPWSVDYSKFVPILIREIQSLRSRISALEAHHG